jgi:signal transduction histidine kinase
MNAIVGFSTLLNTPGLNDEERKEFIGHIKENSEALLMLIDDLLDLSQIEAGNMYVRKERFVVKELITQITKIYISKYGSRNIKLIYSFNNNMANKTINSDPDRLKQVLRNLLENAYKFTEKGSIEIGVDKYSENDKKYIMFFVKDSGIGIPADKLDEVFDRFRKLEMNTDKFYSGVGLGLSISKKIIENLDGRIWAESKEGEYSKFIFIIPAGIED